MSQAQCSPQTRRRTWVDTIITESRRATGRYTPCRLQADIPPLCPARESERALAFVNCLRLNGIVFDQIHMLNGPRFVQFAAHNIHVPFAPRRSEPGRSEERRVGKEW